MQQMIDSPQAESFFWKPEELGVEQNGLKDITDAQIPIFAHCLALQYFLDHGVPFTETKANLIKSIGEMRNAAVAESADSVPQ